MNILSTINKNIRAGRKMLAILVDPDKSDARSCMKLCEKSVASGVDYFLVGSSILLGDDFENCISILKQSGIPVVLFPGNTMQISSQADALLFLSLISGRNPEMLIGRHVLAAPVLKRSSLEVIPTGYLLIDSGAPTSVSYMSGTIPIPHQKNDIAACTAMAGEMLGFRLIYLDAGSGARHAVSSSMITAVRQNIALPLIVGGGIRTPEKAVEQCQAGADMVVIGNAVEEDNGIIGEMSAAIHALQTI
jgi:putative glycerol-1-phosphate prenyltransferase